MSTRGDRSYENLNKLLLHKIDFCHLLDKMPAVSIFNVKNVLKIAPSYLFDKNYVSLHFANVSDFKGVSLKPR